MSNNSILAGLNEEQRRAVLQHDGPILIVAGAGSGKTRVLTSKIAMLLQGGVLPDEILALTFTKKAAGEMKSRVKKMVGPLAQGLSIGTFHSVFIQILRKYHAYIGFPEDFTIYDEDDSESCIKSCVGETLWGPDWNNREMVKQLDEEAKKNRKTLLKIYKPSLIHGFISLLKNNIILPREYRETPELLARDRKNGRERFADIYTLYMRKCHAAGAMDFDDILVYMHYLLQSNADVRRELAEKYTYILVDEFQDTNRIQSEILRMLAEVHRNICVVGDDAQSIYAFRGAKIQNILDFRHRYPDLKTFRLETNYRSTGHIVDAANRLIAHNEGRIPKNCVASRGRGDGIVLQSLPNDREEARFVKEYIVDAVRKGARYKDFAILYRTNAQARALEDELIRAQVPYLVYSGMSFFERAEVKDVLAYFRLVVNPADDEAYKRICNKPARGISDATLSALEARASVNGGSLLAEAGKMTPDDSGLKARACQALSSFSELILSLRRECEGKNAFEAGSLIVEKTGILDFYKEEDGEDGVKKSNNIKELLNSITYFIEDRKAEYESDLPDGPLKVSLLDYLENIALLSNADTKGLYYNCVSLMTSHCSKGLEFKTVFVVGVEEGLYPLIKDDSTSFDEEEERRLFYVSITRAMDHLILTTCENRWKYGSMVEAGPSRFVEEMGIQNGEDGKMEGVPAPGGERTRGIDEAEYVEELF